jgi:hypothetical protein
VPYASRGGGLVAFARIEVPANGTRAVEIPISLRTLAVRREGRWCIEPGRYRVCVARHAGDPAAQLLDADVALRSQPRLAPGAIIATREEPWLHLPSVPLSWPRSPWRPVRMRPKLAPGRCMSFRWI